MRPGSAPEIDDQARFERAVAHWNAQRFFEAHEDWEHLWLRADGAYRRWLQGLIQFAGAFFQFRRGYFPGGFHRLMAGAARKVAGYEGPTRGIAWDRLLRDLEPWIAYAAGIAEAGAFREKPAPFPVISRLDDPTP